MDYPQKLRGSWVIRVSGQGKEGEMHGYYRTLCYERALGGVLDLALFLFLDLFSLGFDGILPGGKGLGEGWMGYLRGESGRGRMECGRNRGGPRIVYIVYLVWIFDW